jgi:hypothetical protein
MYYPSISQILLTEDTYQSNIIPGTVGDWEDAGSWQKWQGGTWVAALVPPGRDNDVFIHQNQEIRLTGNEEVRNLYLFSDTGPGRKLNLQTFDLDVFGGLRCFRMEGQDFVLHDRTSALTDWIFPETGSIVFRGASRTIVDRDSWSGQTSNSRYTVRFDPDPGAILAVNAAFKASAFIIESGTVFQTLNVNGMPASSTFSFNTNDDFGTGSYGTFIIRSGATMISEATSEFGAIIRRSETRSAASFVLEQGATLELLGVEPVIESAYVILDGQVRYHSNQPTQHFLSQRFISSQAINWYHDLSISGSAARHLPSILEISGDFFVATGTLQDTGSSLYLIGSEDQLLDIALLELQALEVNKSGGILSINQPLQLVANFVMRAGIVDFNHHSFTINGPVASTYSFVDGSWINLSELTLLRLPEDWTSSNATFPFFDSYAGEKRYLRLQGSLPDQSGTLSIRQIELPGVQFEANLLDSDNSPIYYHLNAYFELLSTSTSTEPLYIEILANDMVLDDIEDLRISGSGEIAPGLHAPAFLENNNLWAVRRTSLADLNNRTLTLASSGVLSILPIGMKYYNAKGHADGVEVSWKAKGAPYTHFILTRSLDPHMHFSAIGYLSAKGDKTTYTTYQLSDQLPLGVKSEWIYYQVLVKVDGVLVDQSPVLRARNPKFYQDAFEIHPNPYSSGELNLRLPASTWSETTSLKVIDAQGSVLLHLQDLSIGMLQPVTVKLQELPSGVYFLRLLTSEASKQLKWLKR